MSKVDINSMDISTFCDIQGVSQADRFVLNKKYINEGEKSHSDWYNIISKEFSLHPKKEFSKPSIQKSDKNNSKI
jgi:hypothetical protein